MKGPFESKAWVLSGIGFGLIFGASIFYSPAALPLYAVGIAFIVAGFAWSIYSSLTFRRQVEEPNIDTSLEPGERILKVFPGGHRITKFSASIGKWCVTDRRLIYEGSKPRGLGSETDTMSFPLKNLIGLEIVQAGMLDKFLEATFTVKTSGEAVQEKIQIAGRIDSCSNAGC